MINVELVSVGIGLIITIATLGWNIASRIGKIDTTLAELKIMLYHHALNIEKLEKRVNRLEDSHDDK